jgi:hypothetical protein
MPSGHVQLVMAFHRLSARLVLRTEREDRIDPPPTAFAVACSDFRSSTQVHFAEEDEVPKQKAAAKVVLYPDRNGCAPTQSLLFQTRAQRDNPCPRLRTLPDGARVSRCSRAKDHAGLCNARKPCEAECNLHDRMQLGGRPYKRKEEEAEASVDSAKKVKFARDVVIIEPPTYNATRAPGYTDTHLTCTNYSPTSPCYGPCECCAARLHPTKKVEDARSLF